ncbi:MAG: peptide chain release factor N(5)-glutamine methyltransferase [Beijerinckiaceae bacterium]
MSGVSRRALAERLHPVAGEAAAIEARWLLEAVAGDGARLEELVRRRLGGEPVDRVIGSRGFWTLDLAVTPAVLSPRPDTETIVRAALDHAPQAASILDLGTGSGAILLALLAELPEAAGLGVDLSASALDVARGNAARAHLGARASFLQGGWDAALGRRFDLVVSNPPYIPSADIATLDREVRDHDPHLALDGGEDGLACYREIVPLLLRLLTPAGVAVLEIGIGQGEAVSVLAAAAELTVVEIRQDLGGVPRAVVLALRTAHAGHA